MSEPLVILDGVGKTFTLHLRGGLDLPVIAGASFSASPGECVVLGGPSGIGKSSLLRIIYGNYAVGAGIVRVRGEDGFVDIGTADPRRIVQLRRRTMSYVSQFLRVIPRVASLDIVARAATEAGGAGDGRQRAEDLLSRLNIPRSLWSLPPATFSGGEQQRINIARGFAADRPVLLLDEPTASLDAANRQVVVRMIEERKRAGCAIVGIFHDEDVRDAVADRIVDVATFRPPQASLAGPAIHSTVISEP